MGSMRCIPAVPALMKAFEWLSCEKGHLAAASLLFGPGVSKGWKGWLDGSVGIDGSVGPRCASAQVFQHTGNISAPEARRPGSWEQVTIYQMEKLGRQLPGPAVYMGTECNRSSKRNLPFLMPY